jgi:hypothetical protein
MMQRYKQPDGSGIGHYQSLTGLSDKIHSGLSKVKNSKVGKFVYDPAIEGEALKEAGNTVKNVATNVYYSMKEAPSVIRDKEKRSAWWGANKVKVIGLGAFAAAEIGLSLIAKGYLDKAAHTQGIGWSTKDYRGDYTSSAYPIKNPVPGEAYQTQLQFNKLLNPDTTVKGFSEYTQRNIAANPLIFDKAGLEGNATRILELRPSLTEDMAKFRLVMNPAAYNAPPFNGNVTLIKEAFGSTDTGLAVNQIITFNTEEFNSSLSTVLNNSFNQVARTGLAALGSLPPAVATGVATSKIVKKLDKKQKSEE